MSYDMQAEGNNGVSSQTNLGVLPGFTDLSVLNVDASVGAHAAISAGCNGGNGVQGQSGSETDSGVWGDNTHGGFGVSGSTTGGLAGPGGPRGIVAGVWGSNSGQGAGVRGTNSNGDGVFGEGSVGVHGTSAVPAGGATAQGWGVWGEATATGGIGVNGTTLGGSGSAGVSGFSYNTSGPAPGVVGTSSLSGGVQGDGVLGVGKNGVHGQSSSATDSGVWGENISAGYGVSGSTNSQAPQAGVWGHNAGSGYGVRGDSKTGEGVFGQGKNGVHGQSASATDSGVWGENISAGCGVSGSTNSQAPQAGVWGHNAGSGYGVRGDSKTGEGVFGQGKNGVHGQSASATDSGVWGENTGNGAGVRGSSVAGYGGDLSGGHAPLRLRPSGSPGSPTTGSHARGELFVDSQGSLFYCKADGVPGTWVKLA